MNLSLEYIQQKIVEMWRQVFKQDSIPADETFSSLGGGTHKADELFSLMETIFGKDLNISTTIAYDYPTILEQSVYIHRLLQDKADLITGRIKLTKELKYKHANPAEPIAIIGLACRLPGKISNLDDYWQVLKNGIDVIEEVPNSRWDINAYYSADRKAPGKMATRYGGFIENFDEFDAQFFHISPKEADFLDPNHRITLETTWEALENAAIDPLNLKNSMTGVFIGCMFHDYEVLLEREDLSHEDLKYLNSGNSSAIIAGRISYTFNFHGPSMAIDTACSSSLVAIHTACQALRNEECEMAIAGGVNLMLLPEVSVSFSNANMLSPDGRCKSFSADSDGYGRSEGCGIVILKRLSVALQDDDRIIAIIRGSAVNNDAGRSGLTVPKRLTQEEVLRAALATAHLNPADIDYFEAHGTGTPLGDPIEMGAISQVYGGDRERPLYVGSVKSNMGHLEAASGVAALIKVILGLKNEFIPKNLHFTQLNPRIRLDTTKIKIAEQPAEWKKDDKHIRRGVISNFGFAGTNAHMIIEEPPTVSEFNRNNIPEEHTLLISAKTTSALDAQIKNYLHYLQTTQDNFYDICYTSQVGRSHFKFRFAASGKNINDLIQQLENQKPSDHTLAQQYMAGENIDWSEISSSYKNLVKKVFLPTYPFERKRFWAACLSKKETSEKISEPSLISNFEIEQDIIELAKSIKASGNLTYDTILEVIRNQILSILGYEIEPGDTSYDTLMFYEIGVDSLTAATLSRRLQYLFGIEEFNITLIFEYPSIEKLSHFIESLVIK